jgi:hypothetical protein
MTPSRLLAPFMAAVSCFIAGTAWSGCDSFFLSTEIPGNPQYVVYGSVKDENGTRIVNATVRVHVAEHLIDLETKTDVLGRFRTPDVGRVITDMGYEVDPSLITVAIIYPGYHIAHREYRGRRGQKQGAVEMDFRLKKNRTK